MDKLIGQFDAKIWAEEFNKVLVKKGTQPFDPEFLIGWFANAIMAGYDKGKLEGRPRLDALKTENEGLKDCLLTRDAYIKELKGRLRLEEEGDYTTHAIAEKLGVELWKVMELGKYFKEKFGRPEELEELKHLKRELASCTPNGSEFINDPQRCISYIKDQREKTGMLLIKTLKERNKLRKGRPIISRERLVEIVTKAYYKWSDRKNNSDDLFEDLADAILEKLK